MKIYVGNLSFNTEEPQLEQLFSPLGDVASVRLVRDHETGRSRGFGFVEMSSSIEASKAIQELNGRDVGGRQINVSEAKEREGGGGGGRSGGGGGGRSGGGFGRRNY